MQLRSDGTLGFSGGMVDSEETQESSLTRVFEEEAGDLVFTDTDYCTSLHTYRSNCYQRTGAKR